jgi:hypothetical protein
MPLVDSRSANARTSSLKDSKVFHISVPKIRRKHGRFFRKELKVSGILTYFVFQSTFYIEIDLPV